MNPTADALKAKARAVRIEDEVARRGIKLRGKIDRVGACPRCGGDDRFSINTKKQIWNCRGCKPDTVTGDIIGLVEHLDGVDYIHAVETLTGERPAIARPNGHRSPSGPKPPEQQTITYDYRDPDESLAYQVVRRPNKRFAQRRPHGPIIDGKPKAWIWGLLEGTYVRGRNGDYYAAGEHDDKNAPSASSARPAPTFFTGYLSYARSSPRTPTSAVTSTSWRAKRIARPAWPGGYASPPTAAARSTGLTCMPQSSSAPMLSSMSTTTPLGVSASRRPADHSSARPDRSRR